MSNPFIYTPLMTSMVGLEDKFLQRSYWVSENVHISGFEPRVVPTNEERGLPVGGLAAGLVPRGLLFLKLPQRLFISKATFAMLRTSLWCSRTWGGFSGRRKQVFIKMLFTKNALLAEFLALHLGNSLQSGVGLCLLGEDEQESRVRRAPLRQLYFRPLAYAVAVMRWVRAGPGARRPGLKSSFLHFLAV